MIIKKRSKSVSHCILESLYSRQNLTPSDRVNTKRKRKDLKVNANLTV